MAPRLPVKRAGEGTEIPLGEKGNPVYQRRPGSTVTASKEKNAL